ncbi:hypothetical protein TTHERM_00476780 (macronuclear) [Tetrahymena thermophila SB210]|uniref:Uncharacterized protein n=1 Tax=Tetrahymena thermophila (strain SB210) TaxID=312017 RepID=I7MJS3_TETTS|nr:hypothetical protein TTHERM_00476780 [Tetrahymena thermophila SB210]EAR97140.1 hypothetical protein TTHERM_00476780 [Tetrahymena thermophila SB210]|eukprot:XP_001017385.1 hypothetical protein TTHERM_00476780 [Tetrahymena thermophila SB210]
MTIKTSQSPSPSINSFNKQINKQIQTISKDRNHKKKSYYNNVEEQKIKQISKVSKDHLYMGDLITNLNPDELIYILNQYPSFSIQEEFPYQYTAQYQKNVIDFDFDEETDELIQVQNQITIKIRFEIKQISECSTQFTILFQNISKQYDIEYQNLKADLIQNIISF